jgi:hypothetical protein
MGQYDFGILDELDAFVFLISHVLSLEGGLLFLKELQRMYIYCLSLLLYVLGFNSISIVFVQSIRIELFPLWPQF